MFNEEAWWAVRGELFEACAGYGGSSWETEVLGRWLSLFPGVVASLHRIGQPEMAAVGLSDEDRWTLYALSRVVELLIAPHQPAAANGEDEPFHRLLPVTCYAQFIDAVGGSWPAVTEFHPFLHEIVQVAAAEDPDAPPALTAQWWPGFFVGSMLMAREGVTITVGENRIGRTAEHSTLYWAWTRRHRKVADLSHGVGSQLAVAHRFSPRLPDRRRVALQRRCPAQAADLHSGASPG